LGGLIFKLTEEQQLVVDTFARFCDEEIIPKAAAIDDAKSFPQDLFVKLGDLGFFGLRYPESVGGTGADFTTYCLAVSEIARGSLSIAAVSSLQSLMGTHFLYAFGNEDLHQRLLKPAMFGQKIGAMCITEPNAGSDLSSINTSAKKVTDGYVINGQKMWITSASVADFFTVFARTGEDKKLSIFLVEKDFKGLQIGKTIDKMGCYASPTAEVSFNDCFVPEDHLLGEQGQGEKLLRAILSDIRIMTGALAIGVARAAFNDSVKYAEERSQFGRPINRFQAISFKLAQMVTDLEAANHMVLSAAQLKDDGESFHREAAMAKLFATEKATEICDQATRIFGSYGFAMEYPVQRYFRDIRFTLFGGGTSEILKLIIARDLVK